MEFGEVYITRGVYEAICESLIFGLEVVEAFVRYQNLDWGDLCKEDIELNERALADGERILALYATTRGQIYIITEWDRSVTTILFTEEY